jgi:hypothetical protein
LKKIPKKTFGSRCVSNGCGCIIGTSCNKAVAFKVTVLHRVCDAVLPKQNMQSSFVAKRNFGCNMIVRRLQVLEERHMWGVPRCSSCCLKFEVSAAVRVRLRFQDVWKCSLLAYSPVLIFRASFMSALIFLRHTSTLCAVYIYMCVCVCACVLVCVCACVRARALVCVCVCVYIYTSHSLDVVT